MKTASLKALLGYAAIAVAISSCAAPQSMGAIPATTAVHPAFHRSWIRPGSSAEDLLYVGNGNGIVNIYSYATQELIGELTDFTQPEGECTDAKGDVYITDWGTSDIDEYAHGGTTALRVLEEPSYRPVACAIDPKSGDLAVSNYYSDSYSQGSLAIYRHAKGTPKYFKPKGMAQVNGVAYDAYGDLLVTGFTEYSSYPYDQASFAYLPAHGKTLSPIDLPPPGSSRYLGNIEGLGWDGKYFVLLSYYDALRYSINIKPQYEGYVELYGAQVTAAFYEPNPKKQATQAASATFGSDGRADAYLYNYPAGGEPTATVSHGLDNPLGIAISLASGGLR